MNKALPVIALVAIVTGCASLHPGSLRALSHQLATGVATGGVIEEFERPLATSMNSRLVVPLARAE